MTPFGSVPAMAIAYFYKADSNILRYYHAFFWGLLRETDTDDTSIATSCDVDSSDVNSLDASCPSSASTTDASRTHAPTAISSHGTDWLGGLDACPNEHADGDDLQDVEALDDEVSEWDSEDLLAELLPTRHEALPIQTKLTLHTYLLSGRVFAAFAGKASYFTQSGRQVTTLVAKIHRPSTHTASQLYEAAAEAGIYSRLPEGIAPRYHGLFVKTDGERMVMTVLEHAGTPLATNKAARALSNKDK